MERAMTETRARSKPRASTRLARVCPILGRSLTEPRTTKLSNVEHLVAGLADVAAELAHDPEAACVRGLGVVLGEVRPEVAVRDGPGQGVDEGVAEHVAVGMGVEAHRRRDFDPAKDEGETREKAVDIMAEAGAGLVHFYLALSAPRREATHAASANRASEAASVASWTMVPGG